MLNFHDQAKDDFMPEISEAELSDQDVLTEIQELKSELADQVTILGHHYQNDDIIRFADITGDSLELSRKASGLSKPYILFCGVHFMAETADILSESNQQVILPDLNAGCSMADMAVREDIDRAWSFMTSSTSERIIPITYINCAASLKAFVGENDGSICTSSNAKAVIEWAFKRGQKLLFFPDQHLGRNTCHAMGIPLEDMVVYNPNMYRGGLSTEQIQRAKVILWYGYCSVHQGFQASQIAQLRRDKPKMQIIVHPECSFEVVQAADLVGSTSYIINTIRTAPSGSQFAVGTEINLVNRLAAQYTDKEIISLSPYQCLCTTMYRVRPRWLLASLRAIKKGTPINRITVDSETKTMAKKALQTMLEIA